MNTMTLDENKVLALFEAGDCLKGVKDLAKELGIGRLSTAPLGRLLEKLAKQGKLTREVRDTYDMVYNRAFGGPVACRRKRAFYGLKG